VNGFSALGWGSGAVVLPARVQLRHHLLAALRRAREIAVRDTDSLQCPGEIKDLQRTSTVEEYQRQFLALLGHYDHLTRQH
jgi:hypothetical protein